MKRINKGIQQELRHKYGEFTKLTDNNFKNFQEQTANGAITEINKIKLASILYQLYPTYLAPSIMLFLYKTRFDLQLPIKNYGSNAIEKIYTLYKTDCYTSAIEIIYMENIIHSIRILIERIGLILNLVHPEIITDNGFGFINEQYPQGKGVLKYALSHQDEIQYMKELVEANESWISRISKSDNYIKHKKDLHQAGLVSIDENLTPPDIIPTVLHDKKQNIHYGDSNIDLLVDQCYNLINKTIKYVIDKSTE